MGSCQAVPQAFCSALRTPRHFPRRPRPPGCSSLALMPAAAAAAADDDDIPTPILDFNVHVHNVNTYIITNYPEITDRSGKKHTVGVNAPGHQSRDPRLMGEECEPRGEFLRRYSSPREYRKRSLPPYQREGSPLALMLAAAISDDNDTPARIPDLEGLVYGVNSVIISKQSCILEK